MSIIKKPRRMNSIQGLHPGANHDGWRAKRSRRFSTNISWVAGKKALAATICIIVFLSMIMISLSLHESKAEHSGATSEDAWTTERVYVGSITNQSFRVAWTYPTIPGVGYIMWGETPETWNTYVGTDVRADGSTDYEIPDFTYVHLAQTNLGSGQNMTSSTTYWFKVIIGGATYGDDADEDTVYGYANCTKLGVASPGRPWGITTAPDSDPEDGYNITGRVLSPGLDIYYRNGILVMSRLNDGTGDSLPLLDVTRTIGGLDGSYDIDIGISRAVEDGLSYPISEGATIKMFFENPYYGTWPDGQLASTYPDWIYDADQWITMASPQTIHDHTIIRFPDTLPEMTTVGTMICIVALMTVIFVRNRRRAEL